MNTKKIMYVILLSLLVVMGNMYAQTYYTGDGGRNITLAVLEPAGKNFTKEEMWILPLVQGAFNTNFNRYSAISIIDRQNIDRILEQQHESLSGNYSEDDFIRIGRLTNARSILVGTITKTPTGTFMLEFSVSDAEAGRRIASYGPKPFSVSALQNLSAIQEVSADLLDQLGVKLTDAGRRSLLAAADDRLIQAETALSKGIVAQKSGTVVDAFAYYLQAVNYDPSSAEIVSRLDIVNADITSSSMGADIRNAIAWRKAWVDRLSECDQFVAGYARNTPLATTLVYSADFKQGEIDWVKETIPISIDVCLTPDENWPVPITGVVNAIYEGFAGTGQAATWKLDWPLKNAAGRASQVTPSAEVKYNLVLDLLNDKGAVLGRQGVTFSAGWRIEFRNGKSVGIKTLTPQTVTFPTVDANKITETLVIRVASINGRIVSAADVNNVAVRAMIGEDYKIAISGNKTGKVIESFTTGTGRGTAAVSTVAGGSLLCIQSRYSPSYPVPASWDRVGNFEVTLGGTYTFTVSKREASGERYSLPIERGSVPVTTLISFEDIWDYEVFHYQVHENSQKNISINSNNDGRPTVFLVAVMYAWSSTRVTMTPSEGVTVFDDPGGSEGFRAVVSFLVQKDNGGTKTINVSEYNGGSGRTLVVGIYLK